LETVKKLRWTPDIINVQGWLGALIPIYVKKAHQEDPIFQNSKVVYTIYNDGFDETLNKNFRSKSKIDQITAKHLDAVKDPTYVNLVKLAIQYSDAVIIGSEDIHPDIQKHLETINKPILPYHEEDNLFDEYSEFFDKLLD